MILTSNPILLFSYIAKNVILDLQCQGVLTGVCYQQQSKIFYKIGKGHLSKFLDIANLG